MRTSTLNGQIARPLRLLLAVVSAATFLVACETVPQQNTVSVTDLEQQHAQVKQKEQTLAKQKASLKAQQQQLASRADSLAKQEQKLAQAREALEQEKQSLQQAEFKARLVPEKTPVAPAESLVVGELETVFLDPPGVNFDARIDTGSEMSKIFALSVTEFERDGKPYVRFTLPGVNSADSIEITRRIRDQVRVRGANGKSYKRDVVRMRVVLGKIDERVDFALLVRPQERTKVTIGRNVLRDLAVVDVSKQFVTAPQL